MKTHLSSRVRPCSQSGGGTLKILQRLFAQLLSAANSQSHVQIGCPAGLSSPSACLLCRHKHTSLLLVLPYDCCSYVPLASITSHQTSAIQRQFHLPESWADSWLDFSKPLRRQEKLQVADRRRRTSRKGPEDLSEELCSCIKKGGGYFLPFFANAA